MSQLEEQLDLTELPSLEDIVLCTSRSEHPCTIEARFRSVSTQPCPDPAHLVLWCLGRYLRYLSAQKDDPNCHFCKRAANVCWHVTEL